MRKLLIAGFLLCASAANGSTLAEKMLNDLGRNRPANCPNRWCACYLNNKLKSIGKAPNASNLARDFARYGRASALKPGAIIVKRSHVAVMIGTCGNGRIKTVSGNWSRRVGIGCVSTRNIIAIRAY